MFRQSRSTDTQYTIVSANNKMYTLYTNDTITPVSSAGPMFRSTRASVADQLHTVEYNQLTSLQVKYYSVQA